MGKHRNRATTIHYRCHKQGHDTQLAEISKGKRFSWGHQGKEQKEAWWIGAAPYNMFSTKMASSTSTALCSSTSRPSSFVSTSALRRRLPLVGAFCMLTFGLSNFYTPLYSSALKTGCVQSFLRYSLSLRAVS